MDSSNGSANGTAHQSTPFPSHDQSTTWSPPRSRRPNPLDLINSGGLGHAPHNHNPTMSSQPQEKDSDPPSESLSSSQPTSSIPAALDLYDAQYLPGHPKSLSGIALRSCLLGAVLTASSTFTIHLLQPLTYSPLWRAPFFLAVLSLFHFLEFWTTAAYNTRSAQISSFLLSSNGVAYQGAHGFAMCELMATHYFFPDRSWLPSHTLHFSLLYSGLGFIISGQIIRSVAMRDAGTNFNHIVQATKRSSHTLITTGIYSFLRHPSYFGFFWWAIGTQLVLGNICGFLVYLVVLWRFFSVRIEGEEALLVKFFGDEYVRYREKTRVGIPFIS
jgi:protein-S-isoprenylcysteine O-methyltransferase